MTQYLITTRSTFQSMLFQWLCTQDFERIDGWFLPNSSSKLLSSSKSEFGRIESGVIIFTDTNLISSMEQIGFLFQQASKVSFQAGQNPCHITSHFLAMKELEKCLSFLEVTHQNDKYLL
ncbi:hypothetical protein GLYMA_16G116800v4 [Glycine max]|nr:hypothetical protein GLYMA_16G116800v4 [Glycine max]